MSARVSGHALRAEGKPCARKGQHGGYEILPGSLGSALCECGERSRVLGSDGQRKRWHREHKEQVRGGYEAANGDTITEEELRAIQALHRLASRWPQSLTLVSMGGSLHVIHTGDPRYGELTDEPRGNSVLDTFQGIPNDGGDW